MRFLWLCLVAIITALSLATQSAARETVGIGRLLTNDAFATVFDDRWRTGSGVLSWVTTRDGGIAEPTSFGDLVEFRFRGEVISPSNLVRPSRSGRPYATVLSFGAHTHFAVGSVDLSAGADLVLTGPQTGLQELQSAIHDLIDVPPPSDRTLNAQIPNGVHGLLTLEAARKFQLSERSYIRPFAEVQAGLETLVRVGADVHFGDLASREFLIRDHTTGQRYRVQRHQTPGWAVILGGDFAYVADSVLLPASRTAVLSDTRSRLRAGIHWQGQSVGVFYGLTWLSKEFDAQPDGQLLGSLRIDILF